MLHPEVPAFVRILLASHIGAGFVALIVAPIALVSVKGGRAHRCWGKVYLCAMAAVAATALVVAPYFGDWFLLGVAVFSAYLAFSGWRVLRRGQPARGQTPGFVDWLGATLVIAAGLALLGAGTFARVSFGEFAVVLIVFGALAVFLGGVDVVEFVRPPTDRNAWLFRHLGNMTGAYIATVTAFSATNLHGIQPVALRWLWPTAAGSLLIAYWVRRYRREFAAAGASGTRRPLDSDPALGAARTNAGALERF